MRPVKGSSHDRQACQAVTLVVRTYLHLLASPGFDQDSSTGFAYVRGPRGSSTTPGRPLGRTKLTCVAAAAVAAAAVAACSGETDGESPTSPDASPCWRLGVRPGPGGAGSSDRRCRAGRHRRRAGRFSTLVVNNGSDRGLFRGHEFHPEWFGDAVADAVRVRPGAGLDGVGAGDRHRPRYPECRLHRVDVHHP